MGTQNKRLELLQIYLQIKIYDGTVWFNPLAIKYTCISHNKLVANILIIENILQNHAL